MSAKPDTWMPLVIGDYLKDTGRLSTEQHGAYLLLIMDYWISGPPPDEDGALCSITKLDLRAWRKHRDTLARFFRIEDGFWRHKRVEEELERWAAKKEKYVARASAGGRAKAAKSTASSTPQALLTGCLKAAPQPASREVDGPTDQSTLSGRRAVAARAGGAASSVAWSGPESIREAFCAVLGDDWCSSYLDPCRWQDVPERALIPATKLAGSKIIRDARKILASLQLVVLENAA